MKTTKKLIIMLLVLATALQASAGYETLTYNGINYEFYFSGSGSNAVGDYAKVAVNDGFSGDAIIAPSVTCEYTYVSSYDNQGNPIYATRNLTAPVTVVSKYAFRNCRSLTSVIIPNSVTEIGKEAFRGCSGMTSLSLGNSVTTIGDGAFSGCAFASVNLPNSITSIPKSCFSSCFNLTNITIPNSVTEIGAWAFGWCRNLPNVTIPNSVIAIGDSTFYESTGLVNVMIGNSVTAIPRNCFYGCSSLANVTIPNSVTAIGDKAFSNCSALTTIDIPNSVTTLGKDAFYNCSSLTSATLGNSVTSISENAFYDCRNLTGIDIPNSVTTIGDNAFYRCWNLANVTIGNSVTYIGKTAFYDCKSLTSVTIPDAVITIADDAFNQCMNMESLTIGNSVTTIGNNAFLYCRSLKSVVIPNSVTTIGNHAFYNCSGLTSLIIGNSVTSIGNGAFVACTGLTSVDIPNSVTEMGQMVFSSCSNLRSVNISNSMRSIPENCFSGCIRLESVVIPNKVEMIWNSAFYGCRNLSSVTLPNSLRSINNNAFYDCYSLTSVTCLATTPPMYVTDDVFDEHCYETATLFVPAESIDDYRNAHVWEKFFNIQPIGPVDVDVPGDVNGDGEVNIADVNAVIDVLLSDGNNPRADVNNDGEVTIADVNTLIDIILNGSEPTPSGIETFTVNGVSFKMVSVEGGTFTMGAADDDTEAFDSDKPAHQVTLSNYCIGQTEVTQALWLAVMGSNPSEFTSANGYTDNLNRPVECVSWEDCQEFIAKLNQMTGKTFRLPTEAEWEYAARGGNKSQGYKYAGSNTLDDVAWFRDNAYSVGSSSPDYGTHAVATKSPNELGLYDMSGNVGEWCQDWWNEYSNDAQTDPTGPASGATRLYRGGCYGNIARYCRVSIRRGMTPTISNQPLGLRLVLNPDVVEEHEWVDLGLPSGTLWATCNIGANAPEEYGDYFAWGETEPKQVYEWSNYKWGNYYVQGSLSKYVTDTEYGTIDNKTELEPEDDAASVNWGSSWCMPSREQLSELFTKCTKEWATRNGVNGYQITGPNGNTLFLPAAGGYYQGNSLALVGVNGEYWSRSLRTNLSLYAHNCHFYYGGVACFEDTLEKGFTVRAVRVPQ